VTRLPSGETVKLNSPVLVFPDHSPARFFSGSDVGVSVGVIVFVGEGAASISTFCPTLHDEAKSRKLMDNRLIKYFLDL